MKKEHHRVWEAILYHFVDQSIAPNSIVGFFNFEINAYCELVAKYVSAIYLSDGRDMD